MVNKILADQNNLRGFKIKLYPTEEQKQRIHTILHLYRFIYNWTIVTRNQYYYGISEEQFNNLREQGLSLIEIYKKFSDTAPRKRLTFIDLCTKMQEFRNSTEWLKDIPVNIARYAIRDVCDGFKRFFEMQNLHSPHLKKKSRIQKFGCRGERVYFRDDGYVKIEGIDTPILYKKCNIPKHARFYRCTITYNGYDDEYWLSLQAEMFEPILFGPLEDAIGVDVGIRKLVTLSDGTVYKMPDLSRLEKRKRRKQSRVSKDKNRIKEISRQAKIKLEDVPISKRMRKRYKEYRKISSHIKHIRWNFVHNITREIIKRRPSAIVVENISVTDIIRSNVARGIPISDYLMYSVRNQLEYKARWKGIKVIVADKCFPSTQLCSRCGHRHKQGRSETYRCPNCGLVIDRDLNAALNLRGLAT